MLIALAAPCLGASSPYVRTDTELSDDEAEYLQVLFSIIKQTYGIEAFFLINYDYEGGDAFKAYAKDYLNEHQTGDNAMIYAVSSTTYYMNTRGKASDLLLDGDMDHLYESIRAADESGEQYNAAVKFYSALNKLLSWRIANMPYLATTAAANTGEAETKPSEQAEATSGFAETTAVPETTDPTQTTERVIIPGSVDIPDEISPTRGDRLVDQADLLSQEDEDALQQKLDAISEALQFDVVIVTAKHIGSRTPMEFADDYFDYNGFGYGETFDGVCLLISMAERDWWISTCGYGETALSDNYFMSFISPSDFTYYLKNGNYSRSFNFFADVVNDFVTEAKTNQPFSSKHRYQDWKNKVMGVCISLVLGLIVGAIVTSSIRSNYTSSIWEKTEAGAYMVGSVRFDGQYDKFIGSYVNRTRRVRESSDSSSSSSHTSGGHHTSSSGRSHGGGGGKF